MIEFKRRCDFWQAGVAALAALEDVAGPMVDTYNEANHYRQYVKEQYAELSNWMRATRAWPPSAANLNAERQELARIDEQWEALKGQRGKAIARVQQYGSLSGKYQALSEKLRQVGERAVQEKSQVEDLESQLADLTNQWQAQWQSRRDNPVVGEEIRNLLGEIEQEQNSIRQQYEQGARSYDQVLQALRDLIRKARVAQVAIDENHVIDVSGRVIAYR
jgi:chromosome segregation ATPase